MTETLNPIPASCSIPPGCRERLLALQSEALRPLVELGVTMSGISDLIPPYHMGRPNPSHHVVIYTIAGSATLVTPKRRRVLTPGLLWTGVAHSPHHYFVDDHWKIIWFHLDARKPWIIPGDDESPVRPDPRFALLPAVMENCVTESLLDEPFASGITHAYANAIALYLTRALTGHDDPADRRIRHELQVLWEKVNADLQHDWKVADFAELLHVSQVQCHRLVVRYAGTTPMGMVTRLRMQRAEELLRHTDYPLFLIAGMVGYRTAFSFSRAFKSHAGCSPKYFRRRA